MLKLNTIFRYFDGGGFHGSDWMARFDWLRHSADHFSVFSFFRFFSALLQLFIAEASATTTVGAVNTRITRAHTSTQRQNVRASARTMKSRRGTRVMRVTQGCLLLLACITGLPSIPCSRMNCSGPHLQCSGVKELRS